ncbi:MAG: prepilin-type N-terminal cleavage/methylation domain-containing protein [Oscillospiraceae bacterium]|nr:prepilin-type N-terminal cleavage/methylation domain-containing protein [Oscillospiraceae bacterium]
MNCGVKKRRDKKGFTLVELLIVVAIIAVLVAIAIPVYSNQLEKAKEAVDTANLQTAKALAESEWLLEHPSDSGETYYYKINFDEGDDNMSIQCYDTGATYVEGNWQSSMAEDWDTYYLTVCNGEVNFTSSSAG